MTALRLKPRRRISNNAYLPDRSQKGGDSLEDLIKNLVSGIIMNLEELQVQARKGMLKNAAQAEIREEAQELFKQIEALKQILLSLTKMKSVL